MHSNNSSSTDSDTDNHRSLAQQTLRDLPTDPEPRDTPRRLTPAERILGLVLGHLYTVEGSDDTMSHLVFVRDIKHLSTWNEGEAPNSAEDLMVTLHHTEVTNQNPLVGIEAAGNVYNSSADNVDGPMRLRADLLQRTDAIAELPPDATWFHQDRADVSPLEAPPGLADLVKATNVVSVPTPK